MNKRLAACVNLIGGQLLADADRQEAGFRQRDGGSRPSYLRPGWPRLARMARAHCRNQQTKTNNQKRKEKKSNECITNINWRRPSRPLKHPVIHRRVSCSIYTHASRTVGFTSSRLSSADIIHLAFLLQHRNRNSTASNHVNR